MKSFAGERQKEITSECVVGEMFNRWPVTVRFFALKRLPCIGCPMSAFETLAEVCREHRLNLKSFLKELRMFVEKS